MTVRRYTEMDDQAPEQPAGADPPSLSAIEARASAQTKAALRLALTQAGGNVTKAARMLGIPRRTLDYQITRHGLREWLSGAYPVSARQRDRRSRERAEKGIR
jgi:transcriptional regulator of acetoin/glycerol metabolism